ncbi:uncharacterized protein At5g39865-like [Trifolium pratense]|uniref:Uncharacterized protein n=1 Tax=Trifolium pratense TaxID=57577 RepID=A0ACB0JG93_TRIPR|nr:uncharacterized protein At5g39865-like [Trifolium pratense]CAJ2644103.1 unnamed protein product [Trifolium pratense]
MGFSSWFSLSRGDRTSRTTTPTLSLVTPNRTFGSFRSFKDIRTILQTENEPEPGSPKSPTLFRRLSSITPSLLRSISNRAIASSITVPSNFDHGSIVVYYTSLRIIRRTFNDCRTVRSILKRFSVAVDERDVCIDERFREELEELLGRRSVPLPCVFIGGEYIGGVDEFRKIYDSGELQEMMERLPKSIPNVCDFCGGMRFVVCDECDGSHRLFVENGCRTCPSCNTNGLIRCPACFYVMPRHTK